MDPMNTQEEIDAFESVIDGWTNKTTSRNFLVTIWEWEKIKNLPGLPYGIEYIFGQLEETPTTKRLHWQGFVKTSKPVRYTGLWTLLGLSDKNKALCAKDPEACIRYCWKFPTRATEEQGYFLIDFGQKPSFGQGKRNDLLTVITKVREGATDTEICTDDDPRIATAMARNFRGVNYVRHSIAKHRDDPPKIWYIWGRDEEARDNASAYLAGKFGNWFTKPEHGYDGYEYGMNAMIVWITPDKHPKDIKHMCRRGRMTAQTRGGWMKFNIPNIIFVSDTNPVHHGIVAIIKAQIIDLDDYADVQPEESIIDEVLENL